jgi:acetyl esterase/lipase
MLNYQPDAHFEIKMWDVEYLKTPHRALLARIYQPQGEGPFPVVLDLHGGAWNNKNRLANAPMDEALAKSGVLVVAVDMSLAPEAPYPSCVQEASFAVRWLKTNASLWHGDPTTLGLLGSSSGGHVAQLLAMRPDYLPYHLHPLPDSQCANLHITYVATRSPISDPWARFRQAEKMKREHMIKNSHTFFNPWESIHEANPQEMLNRKDPVALPPMLIMQGQLDDNVIPIIQETFCASYRAAGGECQLEIFENASHEWVATPSVQTDLSHQVLKLFIQRQLHSARRV